MHESRRAQEIAEFHEVLDHNELERALDILEEVRNKSRHVLPPAGE
jgi:hypothetical protein